MIQLDLNNPEFQTNLLALGKQDARAVLKTLPLPRVDELPVQVSLDVL